jgi:hypothetical protein
VLGETIVITYSFAKLDKDMGTANPTIDPLVGILTIFLEGECVGRIVEVFTNQAKNCWCDMAINNLEGLQLNETALIKKFH